METIVPQQCGRHALAYRVWQAGCFECGWADTTDYRSETAALDAATRHDRDAHGTVIA